MAVAPLFVANLATLQGLLRLTGAVNADTVTAIGDAIERARYDFYDALGGDRIAVILAITYTANPTTANGLLRAKANTAEVIRVRQVLMRLLPMLFMDSSSQVKQRWNEEGLTRNNTTELEKELDRMQVEFEILLQALKGDTTAEASSVQGGTIGPLEVQPQPGASISPNFLTGVC